MRDSHRIILGVVASMIIVISDVVLLFGGMDVTAFWIIFAVGMVVIFIPMFLMKGDWVELHDTGIRIKAPMVDLDIPFSKVTGIDCVHGFKPGVRTYGYGGLKRGSGDFVNDALGSYTFAGTTSIPSMIIVRFYDKKERYVAFNSIDDRTTRAIYERIRAETSAGGIEPSDPVTAERNRKKNRSTKRITYGILGVVLATAVIIVVVAMGAGHVDVSLDEDSVSIDATMMKEDILYADITGLELRENMDYGTRIAGLGNSEYLSGNFRNDEFGKYRLAVHRAPDLCVVVYTADKVCVFNMDSNERTEALFEELEKLTSVSKPLYTATVPQGSTIIG